MSQPNYSAEKVKLDPIPRLIAFYLPQFHPIPENDVWWGKGFTEWTNVSKARPLYEAHYQPHLPADLGFYDLRVRETRREQIQLAKSFGIDAFCYHYYWFSGKRLLERPLDDMLQDAESDMPFCVCWANETWTRRWNGKEEDILIAQEYRPEDDEGFIRDLLPYLQDSRYLRVDNKPFIIVYRPTKMPNPVHSTAVWRHYCREVGLGEIHLCAAFTFGNESYQEMGFDSGVEFPPHHIEALPENDLVRFFSPFRGKLYDYSKVATGYIKKDYKQDRVFKTVFPSWDNTARTAERAVIMHHATPDNFEYWLAQTMDQAIKKRSLGDSLVFINAWNEWAEGCHLEPDRLHGLGFLEAVRRVKRGERRFDDFQLQEITLYLEEDIFSFLNFFKESRQHYKRHFRLLVRSFALVFIRSNKLRKPWIRFMEWVRLIRWNVKKVLKRMLGKI